VASFAEPVLRMGLLEIARPDLGRREVGRDRQHRQRRAMAVEQAVDEMQVAGATASGAHGEAAAEMGLGTRREGRNLLVADVKPLNLSVTADRIGQPVQAIADDSVDPASHPLRRGSPRIGPRRSSWICSLEFTMVRKSQ
jgi:hypothetical protein